MARQSRLYTHRTAAKHYENLATQVSYYVDTIRNDPVYKIDVPAGERLITYYKSLAHAFGLPTKKEREEALAKVEIPGRKRNPIYQEGELVLLRGVGDYAGKEAEIVEKVKKSIWTPRMYRVKMVKGGDIFLVRESAIAPFGSMSVTQSAHKTHPSNYRPSYSDYYGYKPEHKKTKGGWPIHKNPTMHATCPVHGNPIRLHRGWHTVTCPIGGETLGIKRR